MMDMSDVKELTLGYQNGVTLAISLSHLKLYNYHPLPVTDARSNIIMYFIFLFISAIPSPIYAPSDQ